MKKNNNDMTTRGSKMEHKRIFGILILLLMCRMGTAQVVVKGNVYGGCEEGKVTVNTNVTINGGSTEGSVYGGGMGVANQKLKGWVKGNTKVEMTGGVVHRSIYGGGELGSVGTFTDSIQVSYTQGDNAGQSVYVPTACQSNTGVATVIVSGGFVGVEGSSMPTLTNHDPDDDDRGWIFCGSKGDADSITNYQAIAMGVVDSTYLEIKNTGTSVPAVTASVYGGCENGLVLRHTSVKIMGGQIGTGYQGNQTWDAVYVEDTHWTPVITALQNGTYIDNISTLAAPFHECDAWPYGVEDPNTNQTFYYVYDIHADSTGYDHQGGNIQGSDGHSFFGNVFGGGSGYYPIATGVWRKTAGQVNGNTYVEIIGGHILNNVYGGNEYTNVKGTSHVTMSGGTVGIPRTLQHIQDRPVACNIFGGCMGDKRAMFNDKSNVKDVVVNISGGVVFGSVYGGGEDGHVTRDANVTISGNAWIGTFGYSNYDGHVFGGGRGFSGENLNSGIVQRDATVQIKGGTTLGSVYGGGRLGSIGGLAKVEISNGIIGNDYEAVYHVDFDSLQTGGNVFGGSKGGLTLLDGTTINPIWPNLGQADTTSVVIRQNTDSTVIIKGTVYGGGEIGTVTKGTSVAVSGGTVWRNVFGGGFGSTNTTLTATYNTNTVTPMEHAGRVFHNTNIELSGGWIKKNVYGGGAMASVGTITSSAANTTLQMSWPVSFTYASNTGKTNIEVTGGRVGITGKDFMGPYAMINNVLTPVNAQGTALTPTQIEDAKTDNGDIYGGSRGEAGPSDTYFKLANVNETEINIDYTNLVVNPTNYKDNPSAANGCIAGAVYGGGEDGHVNTNTNITLDNGLVGHAMYGGGKGKGKYDPNRRSTVYSRTAGKVYGNTNITVNGGYVVRSVFGGGNLASVGKGNYIGLENGETKPAAGSNDSIAAATSGIATINIFGGTLGMLNPANPGDVFKDSIPYGTVFGGARGKVVNSTEDFFGFVNETRVNIGDPNDATSNPRLFGSVYGGAQDGHVRRTTKVTVNSGEIGVAYVSSSNANTVMGNTDLSSWHWTTRGNVFGGGSGWGSYDENDPNTTHNSIAGSVLGTTNVEIKGGTIHCNIYGGGSLSLVQDQAIVNIKNTVGVTSDAINNNYGGYVFGAGRGNTICDLATFATTGHTEVNIDSLAMVPQNVYGGGELGQVIDSTVVNMITGTVGTFAYDWKTSTNHSKPYDTAFITSGGSIYGGGKGDQAYRDAALVKGNTNVNINGGQVYANVYGGGEIASVGQRTVTHQNPNDPTSAITAITPVDNTGLAKVTINGGVVGLAPRVETGTPGYEIPFALNGFDGNVYGGGKGIGDDPMGPTHIFGQYYEFADVNATLVTVNITSADQLTNRIWGSVFGGAEDGHVLDTTKVIFQNGLLGTAGTSGYDGNIFGGGRNYLKKNYTAGRVGGNTIVEMTGGQIYGNIYGGGRFALTGIDYKNEMQAGNDYGNTLVKVKGGILGNNTSTNNPSNSDEIVIETFSDFSMGNVYGGGKGDTEGIVGPNRPSASALLIGLVKNSEVIISEEDPTNHPTHVYGIVFGGGEVANVGQYKWDLDEITHEVSNLDTVANTGWARVTINGGIIGGNRAKMRCDMASSVPDDGNYWTLYNDDLGYVYGGGEGIVDNPKFYDTVHTRIDGKTPLINLMATVNHTQVTINGGWVKASVFGGAEAGHVKGNTLVTINGGQIGAGDNTVDNRDDRYDDDDFVNPLKEGGITEDDALYRTVHWDFGNDNGGETHYDPFDLVLLKQGITPSDGKSWFGNVFGGGSGWFPYVDSIPNTNTARCSWNPNSGKVWGNTRVVINGGHILNNVYGANESTDVGGKATIEMRGGTVGVPQTTDQIKENPSFGMVFGGGCGDPRPVFDNLTVVDSTNVIITGGVIYGSLYGGAEDGHVLGDTRVTVNENDSTTIIGCTGLSTTDGNIFGGGRNFFGENPAAGRVEGNIFVTMTSGHIQGSIFGGGRQALSGVNESGVFPSSNWTVANHGNVTINVSGTATNSKAGTTYSTVIGNGSDQGIHLLCENDESIGDIFGSGKGDTKNYMNIKSGCVTNTTINISGSPRINGAVFGGGEMASVGWWDDDDQYIDNTGNTKVIINGTPIIGTYLELNATYLADGFQADDSIYEHSQWTMVEEVNGVNRVLHTCTGNVFGGSQGDVDFEGWDEEPNNWPYMASTLNDTVIINGGTIMGSVFGGSEQGTVNGTTYVKINGGTIGTIATDGNGEEYAFGNVYGAGYGSDEEEENTIPFTMNNVYPTYADSIAGRVFGSSRIDVLRGTMVGNAFGGAAYAYAGNTTLNVGDATSPSDYTVMGSFYGANNRSGTVTGNVNVNINAGTIGEGNISNNSITRQSDVFGGGLGEATATKGNVTVTVDTLNRTVGTTIYGDVYGGSEFGSVNDGNEDQTIVNIMAGTLATYKEPGVTANGNTYYSYYGGNVFGGGLGESGDADKGKVNGVVTVNIGSGNYYDADPWYANLEGDATIMGNVYGCNNTGGSPQDNVTVNIFKTAHTQTDSANYVNTADWTYALNNVFGGGNEADYAPLGSSNTSCVNIISCDNTVERVFGGGNAAASTNDSTNIQGGRFDNVFGGGNGERGANYAANISGNASLAIHGGMVNLFFGGSNENGTISGQTNVTIDDDGPCGSTLDIDEIFCGGNYVDVIGEVITTVSCADGMNVRCLYGGCNQADILDWPEGDPRHGQGGNVHLIVQGGTFENVYGGSKGRLADNTVNPPITAKPANIEGNILLEIQGGTIDTIFGGNNVLGNVNGNITVIVNDAGSDCPLEIYNVYGAGRNASYTPTKAGAHPEVQILNGTVLKVQKVDENNDPVLDEDGNFIYTGNVFGGGFGASAVVTSNPKVIIGGSTNSNHEATVEGNVYGGGHGAQVVGNTNVVLDGTSKANVNGNVYGGGNAAEVQGNTKVEIVEPRP